MLHNQLAISSLDGKDRRVVGFRWWLDENGYLAQTWASWRSVAADSTSAGRSETALVQLQHRQPGSARNLANVWHYNSGIAGRCAAAISDPSVSNHLERLAAHDYAGSKTAALLDDGARRAAFDRGLEPNKREFDKRLIRGARCHREAQDKWLVRLNAEAMPKLRVNQICQYHPTARWQKPSKRAIAGSEMVDQNLQQRFKPSAGCWRSLTAG
jgi:DNA-directed RNA polymerase specialized sigma54-like protein